MRPNIFKYLKQGLISQSSTFSISTDLHRRIRQGFTYWSFSFSNYLIYHKISIFNLRIVFNKLRNAGYSTGLSHISKAKVLIKKVIWSFNRFVLELTESTVNTGFLSVVLCPDQWLWHMMTTKALRALQQAEWTQWTYTATAAPGSQHGDFFLFNLFYSTGKQISSVMKEVHVKKDFWYRHAWYPPPKSRITVSYQHTSILGKGKDQAITAITRYTTWWTSVLYAPFWSLPSSRCTD